MSAGSRGRGGLRLPGFFLIEPESLSLTDLVGDLEGELLLLVGDSGGRSVVLSLSLESVLLFFFGEDLEKKVGRTIGGMTKGVVRVGSHFKSLQSADGGRRIAHCPYPCIRRKVVRFKAFLSVPATPSMLEEDAGRKDLPLRLAASEILFTVRRLRCAHRMLLNQKSRETDITCVAPAHRYHIHRKSQIYLVCERLVPEGCKHWETVDR